MRRRLLISFIITVAALATGLMGSVMMLKTQAGQRMLAFQLARTLSTPDMDVTISDLSGDIFNEIHVASIAVKDGVGVWFTATDIDFAWHPWALLNGRLDISRLSVGETALERMPTNTTGASAEPSGVPRIPFAVTLDALELHKIVLSPAVVGDRMAFRLSGHMTSDTVKGLSSAMHLDALEGAGAALSLDANIDPDRTNLTLRLDATEPERGLIGRLLGITDSPAMALSVSGNGPLVDWSGAFEFSTGSVAAQPDTHIAGTLSANLQDDIRLRLTGQANVPQILPTRLAALGAAPMDFDVRAHVDTNAWSAHVDEFSIRTNAGRAGGNVVLQLETLALKGHLEADITQTISLADGVGFDTGHVALDLDGFVSAPKFTIKGMLAAPRIAGISARTMQFDGYVATPLDEEGAPFELRATLEAPQTGQPSVDALLAAGGIRIEAHGSVLTDSDHVAFEGLTFAGENFSLLGDGWIDYAAMKGELTIDGQIPDLAQLPVSGLEALQGHASVHAYLRGGVNAVQADWRAKVLRIKTGLAALDSWSGPELNAAGVLSTTDGETWRLDTLTLKSAATALRGDASFILSTGRVDGRFTGEAESLAPIGTAFAVAASGRAQIQGGISGILSDPDLTIDIQAMAPRVGSLQGDLVGLTVHARTVVSAPSGQVAFRFVLDGEEATGNSTFTLRAAQDLRLDNIRIQAADGTATGALVWMIPLGIVTGSAKVEGLQLHSLGRIAGVDLGGTVDGSFTLDQDRGTQRMSGQINAEKLHLPQQDLRIAHVSLAASGRQGAGEFTFDGAARLLEITTPYGEIKIAGIQARGTPSQADATLTLQGSKDKLERLSLQTRIMRDGDVWTAAVSALDGLIQTVPVTLVEPSRISYSSSRLKMECSTFTIAGGGARMCIDLTPDQVDSSIMLSALPLSMFAPWLPVQSAWSKAPQGGTVGLELALHGASHSPEMKFQVTIDDVRLSTDDTHFETVNLNASGTFNHGMLDGSADLSGPGDALGHMQMRLPMVLSLSPFVIAIDEQDSFEAALRLEGTMDGVQRILPLDPHLISGIVKAQMDARGSLSDPRWDGTVQLVEGRYENLKTGTSLRDIAVDLRGSGDKFTLQVLRASDGVKGSLEGHGEILVTGMRGATLNLALNLKDLNVTRRDDVAAVATGNVNITGPAEAPHITGDLTLSPIEIRIPDTLPAEVVALPISQTVGAPSAPVQDVGIQAGGPSLDLTVNIPERMFLRGRGLTSEWAGRFKVLRQDAVMQIEGALRPVRGEYLFAGKAFRLSEGSVTFTNGGDLIPVLNLAAEYSRRDFKAIIHIEGPANGPRINFTSVPELPQDEILARVLFGRSTGQLSALEAIQLTEAITQLSGNRSFGGSGLETLRRAIGTDVLRFEGGDSDQGPSATTGKYVTDDVFVGVKQGTTPKSTGATIEVELTPHISLDSEVHQDSSSRVGVKWKWDY